MRVHLIAKASKGALLCGDSGLSQGCQMVCFQTQNQNLGKFWRALEWKKLVYSMAIWIKLWPFGILSKEKSGNPGLSFIGFTRENKMRINFGFEDQKCIFICPVQQ
jgi:hypothetical protein